MLSLFPRLQCLLLYDCKDYNVFSHYAFRDYNVFCHLCFQRLQCLQSFMLLKRMMSSVIYTFRDYNVFSHLRFLKTTMSSVIYAFQRLQCLKSFTFQRLQCLQSFTFQRLQCLSHLCGFWKIKDLEKPKRWTTNFEKKGSWVVYA